MKEQQQYDKVAMLYKILSGRMPNKRFDYPLFNWDTMLDSFIAFHDAFCDPLKNRGDKSVELFNKLYSSNVAELRKLRVAKSDFEIIQTIGKGHFGEVAVVREKRSDNVYAMKVLKKAATLSQDNMAFYFEERDIMAFANSEWVVTLHYAFQDHESLYLVMDFMPGGDLLGLLNQNDDCIVDEDTARFYLSEIIIATNCVHKIGYVHRDIKPENILIDLTGHVKLADFGSAARLMNGNQVYGKMPVGTPEYIAPEVLTSMDSGGGKYGTACDYWSIGVVFYEMVFGMLPFEADSVLQLYSSIMSHEKSLEIPQDEEVPVTPEVESLIRGLICDQKTRLGYSALASHDFFKSIDWTTIKNLAPPFVPKVTSRFDTSNFETINTASSFSASQSRLPPSSSKFSPSNTLPFIGFSFTRSLNQQLQEDINKAISGSTARRGSINASGMEDLTLQSITSSDTKLIGANVQLTAEYKALKSDLKQVRSDLEKSKKELASSQTEMRKAESEKNHFVDELERQKVRYKELSEKYDEAVIAAAQTAGIQEAGSATTTTTEEQTENQHTLNIIKQLFEKLDDFLVAPDGTMPVEEESFIYAIRNKFNQFVTENQAQVAKIEKFEMEAKTLQSEMDNVRRSQEMAQKHHIETIHKLKETIASLEALLEKSNEESRASIAQLKDINNTEKETVKQLRSENRLLQLQKHELIKSKENDATKLDSKSAALENQVKTLESSLQLAASAEKELHLRVAELEQQLDIANSDVKSGQITMLKLQQSSADKDATIIDLQGQVVLLEASVTDLKTDMELQSVKLREKTEDNLANVAKIMYLKSQLRNANSKGRTFSINMNNVPAEHSRELRTLKEEVEDRTAAQAHLTNTLNCVKQEVEELKHNVEGLEAEKALLESSVYSLNETIAAQKASNYAMIENLGSLEQRLAYSNSEIARLHNELDASVRLTTEERVRLTETIKQQEKLIQFLQTSNIKKKKTFSKSSKNHDSSLAVGGAGASLKSSHNNSYKSFMIGRKKGQKSFVTDKERDAILRNHAREIVVEQAPNDSEINSQSPKKSRKGNLKSSTNNRLTINSKESQALYLSSDGDLSSNKDSICVASGSQSMEEDGHYLNKRMNCSNNFLCMVCYTPIGMLKPSITCRMCLLVCHADCSENIFYKCGKRTYKNFNFVPLLDYYNKHSYGPKNGQLPIMGWVNMLAKLIKTKTEWEQRWMVVTQEQIIFFKTQKTEDQLKASDTTDIIESFSIVEGTNIEVCLNVRASETLKFAGTTDSKTYWKVVVTKIGGATDENSKNSHITTLYFSSPPEEKVFWFSIFRNISRSTSPLTQPNNMGCLITQNPFFMEGNDYSGLSSYLCSLKMNNELTLVAWTHQLVIANYTEISPFVKLQGFNQVHQMVRYKDLVYMIHGMDQHLLRVDVKVFTNEFKNKTHNLIDTKKLVIFPNHTNIHLMALGKADGEKVLAIASDCWLFVYKSSSHSPIFKNKYDIPVTCLTIVASGVLFYTNTVNILNIKSKQIKTFANTDSNTSAPLLGEIPYYNSLLKVLTVNKSKGHQEYMFCYSECALFISHHGISSRKIVTWTGVPTQFEMARNVMSVCYYDHLEVYDLSNKTECQLICTAKLESPLVFYICDEYLIVSVTNSDPSTRISTFKVVYGSSANQH